MLLGLDRLGFFPMLRRCSCVIALAVMLVGSPTAQAADTTLTLACQGTTQRVYGGSGRRADPVPISMGVIVNFTAGTVTGFTDPIGSNFTDRAPDFPVKISSTTDMKISFDGSHMSGKWTVVGSIDRVTGDVDATLALEDGGAKRYSLKCSPAQRMF
jgi:hypothetical protein